MKVLLNFLFLISLSSTVLAQWNTVTESTYNDSGDEIKKIKTFKDKLGRTHQVQSRDFRGGNVIGVQRLFEKDGSVAGQSLPVPYANPTLNYTVDLAKGPDNSTFDADDLENGNPFHITSKVGQYYSNTSVSTAEPNMPTTSYPYSRTVTDKKLDPTSTEVSGIGEAFRIGEGHSSRSHRYHITDELYFYDQVRAAHFNTQNPITTRSGFMHVTVNPGGLEGAAVTFVNNIGQTVATAAIVEGLNEYNPDYFVFSRWSFYYYNLAGQIIAEVSPKGVENRRVSNTLTFTTYYTYDHYGSLINVNSTDEGIQKYRYARDGRVRFSQSQEQRSRNENVFSFTDYDSQLRPFYMGESSGGTDFENLTSVNENSLGQTFSSGVSDWRKVYYDNEQSDYPSPTVSTNDSKDYSSQRNLLGQISKTESSAAKTWYSYDDQGNIEHIIRYIQALNSYFTIGYRYDYLGNVTTVAYNEGTSEAFFHHYTYDENQSLKTVSTDLDNLSVGDTGYNPTLHATYHYTKLGALKRIEYAEDLQGIDFTYTLQGRLKAINYLSTTEDPGNDAPETTGFFEDIFGMSLEYFKGDYVSTKGNSAIQSMDKDNWVQDNYDGKVKAIAWGRGAVLTNSADESLSDHIVRDSYSSSETSLAANNSITLIPGFHVPEGSPFEGKIDNRTYSDPSMAPEMFSYDYDPFSQMDKAIYSEKSDAWDREELKNRVDGPTGGIEYDQNGNIEKLRRRDDAGVKQDFAYTYVAGKNQLASVANYADYTYDASGRVVHVNYDPYWGNSIWLSYDAYDNVIGIYSDAARTTPVVTYIYDDLGNKLMQKVHRTGWETWYIRDLNGNPASIYYKNSTGSLFQGEVPLYGSSRFGTAFKLPSGYQYNYEMTDNQGSVRSVFTKSVFMMTATMEDHQLVKDIEEGAFLNIPASRHIGENHTSTSIVPGANKSAWLNPFNSQSIGAMGPAKFLEAKAGDHLSFETRAKYNSFTVKEPIIDMGALVSTTFSTATGTEVGASSTAVSSEAGMQYMRAGGPEGNLVAYMGYLIFDKNSLIVETGVVPVTSSSNGNWSKISYELDIIEDGYVYLYLANESDANVFFDDFSISHEGLRVVKEVDYYPFGMVLKENKTEDYRYGYQGQYAEYNEETKLSEFKLRMYDPVIARWISPDPYGQFYSPYLAMGNNPGFVDPDGGLTIPPWEELSRLAFENAISATSLATKVTTAALAVGGTGLTAAVGVQDYTSIRLTLGANETITVSPNGDGPQYYIDVSVDPNLAPEHLELNPGTTSIDRITDANVPSEIKIVNRPILDPNVATISVPYTSVARRWSASRNIFKAVSYAVVDGVALGAQHLISPLTGPHTPRHIDGSPAARGEAAAALYTSIFPAGGLASKGGAPLLSRVTAVIPRIGARIRLGSRIFQKTMSKQWNRLMKMKPPSVRYFTRGGRKSLDAIFDGQKRALSKYRGNIAGSTNHAKGVFGEIATDVKFTEKGFKALHTRKGGDGLLLDDWGGNGIDHIYKKGDDFYIVESKYGTSELGKNTLDGPQMSDDWIEGSDRIFNIVGDRAKELEIINSDYVRVLSKISPDGSVVLTRLNEFGMEIGNFIF